MNQKFQVKTPDLLVWKGWVVMSRSEAPLMRKAVEQLAAARTTRVLEIGFGLGISAQLIHEILRPKRHDILELNDQIHSDLKEFCRGRSGVRALQGDFWDFNPRKPYDVVFYDPFDYVDGSDEEDADEKHEYGIDMAERLDALLAPGGVFCWPHFAETTPPRIPGYRRKTTKLKIPAYLFQDGTETQAGRLVTWTKASR